MNRPHLPLSVIALAPLLIAAASGGVTYLETDEGATVHWETDEVRFHFDETPDPGVNRDAAETALVRSLGVWAATTAPALALRYGGRIDDAEVGYRSDGPNRNVVTFHADGWATGDESLAVTLSTYVQSTGTLLDSDIIVNTSEDIWSTDAEEGRFDLQSALIHEIGHALGIGHHEHNGSVMAVSLDVGHARHELSEIDIAAVTGLYEVDHPEHDHPTLAPEVIARAEQDVDIDYPAERAVLPSCAHASRSTGAWWAFAILTCLLIRRRRVLAVTMLVCGLAAPAHASSVLRMSIDDLTAASGIVVQATIMQTSASWENGIIVTRAEVEIDTCLQGPCPEEAFVTVIGGRVGDIVQVVAGAPELHPGLEVVAFLRPVELEWQPVGLGQGVFYIDSERAEAIPATDGLRVIDAELGVTRHADATPLPLPQLMSAIEHAVMLREDLP